MRHGGASWVYNETGDLSLVKTQLGVTKINTALIYAKRDQNALADFSKQQWKAQQEQEDQEPQLLLISGQQK